MDLGQFFKELLAKVVDCPDGWALLVSFIGILNIYIIQLTVSSNGHWRVFNEMIEQTESSDLATTLGIIPFLSAGVSNLKTVGCWLEMVKFLVSFSLIRIFIFLNSSVT